MLNIQVAGALAPVIVGLLTVLAQVERSLIRERTVASIEHRRATGGDLGGRPRSYSDEQAEQLQLLLAEGMSLAAAFRACGLPESTARRVRSQRAGHDDSVATCRPGVSGADDCVGSRAWPGAGAGYQWAGVPGIGGLASA